MTREPPPHPALHTHLVPPRHPVWHHQWPGLPHKRAQSFGAAPSQPAVLRLLGECRIYFRHYSHFRQEANQGNSGACRLGHLHLRMPGQSTTFLGPSFALSLKPSPASPSAKRPRLDSSMLWAASSLPVSYSSSSRARSHGPNRRADWVGTRADSNRMALRRTQLRRSRHYHL